MYDCGSSDLRVTLGFENPLLGQRRCWAEVHDKLGYEKRKAVAEADGISTWWRVECQTDQAENNEVNFTILQLTGGKARAAYEEYYAATGELTGELLAEDIVRQV